ncbi:MAG: transglutaminase domain-containing protein [Caulobacter sp.]
MALAVGMVGTQGAWAQATTTLPSMRFARGELISPSAAVGYYGAATTRSSSFTGVSGFEGRAPEIVELARALKGDETDQAKIADLILEHVRNSTDTAFTFGLSKGPLGTIVDKSGTPFDQAALVVELARQSGLNARYRIGQVRLTAAQFSEWTGIADRQAACRFLANGGIPASFPEATPADCSSGGSFTTVTLLHAWAEVEAGGVWRTLDASFKVRKTGSINDVAALAGLVASAPATAGATGLEAGSQSSAPYIRNAGSEQIDALLSARSLQLLDAIRGSATASTEDLSTFLGDGGRTETYIGATTWASAPPYVITDPGTVITGDLPDQYRTKLHVRVEFWISPSTPAPLERQLYADEIYGRRLEIDTDFDENMASYHHDRVAIELDDVPLATWSRDCQGYTNGCTPGFDGILQLSVDHPYAAGSGGYADQTVRKYVGLTVPVAIVAGFGSTSDALGAKWAGERAKDELLPRQQGSYQCEAGKEYQCFPTYRTSAADQQRHRLAANWLAVTSQAFYVHNRLAAIEGQHHHSLGVTAWRYKVVSRQDNTLQIADWSIAEQTTNLDVDSMFSLASRTNDAGKVQATSRAFAVTAAALEGALVEQVLDTPDSASTAARFAWANRPDEDPCNFGARRFYSYASASAADRPGLLLGEGSSGCTSAYPQVYSTFLENGKTRYAQALDRYVAAGYQSVVGSAETFLGPGHRVGAQLPPACSIFEGVCYTAGYDETPQRGGAISATRYEGAIVAEVAHAIVDRNGVTKGGAGKDTERQGAYDPNRAADLLKDRFVDRGTVAGVDLKTGLAGYTSPTLAGLGGEAPLGLQYTVTYKAGAPCIGDTGPCTGPVSGGWSNNWEMHFSVSGSAAESLGSSSLRAAPASLAAFAALQAVYADTSIDDLRKDVYANLMADWWRRQMVGNTATVAASGSAVQFVKLADGTWWAPMSPASQLLQTGAAVKVRDNCSEPAATRRWDWMATGFTAKIRAGDTLIFAPWKTNYIPQDVCAFTYGFKPTSWSWAKGGSLTFATDGFGKVTGITSSSGRTATLSTVGVFAAGDQTAAPVVNAKGETTRVDFAEPVARSATARPVPFQRVATIYEPVEAGASTTGALASLSYVYDNVGRVREARDGVAIQGGAAAHRFFFAEGARAQRIDPLGGRYTVYFDQNGDGVRHTDELGRQTASAYDGRHRVSSRTYPEGDVDQFKYDERGNVVELRKIAKPGSGLADLVMTAGYDATWNKPSWVKDARGNQTDLVYVASGNGAGEILTATQPAVNGVRPVWSFEYGSAGLPTKATDPTGVVTTTTYDALGNPTTSTLDPSGVNATTCKAYDAVGNLVSETDPRAGVCP